MKSERFEMRVPVDLLARVDAARGYESRGSFFRRAVVALLGGTDTRLPRVAEDVLESQRYVEASGCPDCGGLWTRREGAPGRFCVDCGAVEVR